MTKVTLGNVSFQRCMRLKLNQNVPYCEMDHWVCFIMCFLSVDGKTAGGHKSEKHPVA